VPVGLSDKPTLSVRVRSPEPIERDVTLSYITNNFDWQADYIAELSPGGDRISLFAWLTMANGDETGLANAQTQAAAGKLNRDRVWVPQGEAKPITISCWPQGTTSDIPPEVPPPPPPPPPPAMASPPPMPERGGEEIVLTGSRVMAQQERLGEIRLYRIPIAVTVASRSQKQVALLDQPSVRISSILRLRLYPGHVDAPLERVLVTRNRQSEGLGLPLPAGKVALFGRREGHRILIGEGRIDDHTIGEKVEIPIATATGVRAVQVPYASEDGGGYRLTLTNDFSRPQLVEIELPLGARARAGALVKREGWMLWRVTVPANGTSELRWRTG
jgi:hypothetical protein